MLLPPTYAWLEPVLVASLVVFVISLVGNFLSFRSRLANAFVTALVFAVVFGVLTYTTAGLVKVDVRTPGSAGAPGTVTPGKL